LVQATPLISVALCTYNGAQHLEEQIKSIIAQTYKNVEIIAVDDCSTDATLSILEKYKTKATIQVHSNPSNLGYIKNFEKAISLCHGEFIALSDQDDIWEPHKLQRLFDEIKDNILIYADSMMIDHKGENLDKKISTILNFIKGHKPEAFLFHNCVAGHTMMFKKELMKYIFPFPENLFHDWWIAFAASAVGEITYVDECLVKYRQHNATNTDMLHLRTPKKLEETEKSKRVDEKTLGIVRDLSVYNNFAYLSKKDKSFIEALIRNYQSRINGIFSFKLFFQLASKRKTLYYIPKDPFIYKAVHILKEGFGSKIKRTYYQYKERQALTQKK
jgi:glycosyltransferase involved in cell wall biosynthesis